jgi:hypothetical protein
MTMRRLPCLFSILALAAALPALAQPPTTPAAAQAAPVYRPTSLKAERGLPRTPDGHPDFQGVVWDSYFFAPLQASQPKLAPTLVVSEGQAKTALDGLLRSFLDNPAFKAFLQFDPVAE